MVKRVDPALCENSSRPIRLGKHFEGNHLGHDALERLGLMRRSHVLRPTEVAGPHHPHISIAPRLSSNPVHHFLAVNTQLRHQRQLAPKGSPCPAHISHDHGVPVPKQEVHVILNLGHVKDRTFTET